MRTQPLQNVDSIQRGQRDPMYKLPQYISFRSVRFAIFALLGIALFGALLLRLTFGIDTVEALFTPRLAKRITPQAIELYAQVLGSKRAAERYYNAARARSVIEQHEIAHAVGRMLYAREKLGALAACGTDFNYGCLHEVLGQAIQEYGEASSTLARFIDECRRATGASWGPCAHGIGHGLTYFSGYDEKKLGKDLAVCDTIHVNDTRINPTQSCYTGVFMEYNEQFMDEGDARSFDAAHPLAPCNALTEPLHRSMCVFWLIPWMHGVIYSFSYAPETFSKLADFCRETVPAKERDICLISVGRSIGVNASMSPERTRALCDAAMRSPREFELCITRAAYSYRGEGNPKGADALCSYVSEEKQCAEFDGRIGRNGI